MPTDDELREMARESAKEKVGFYTHLAVFVAVNLFLIALWWATTGPQSFPWFIFPLLRLGDRARGPLRGCVPRHGVAERMTEREFRRLKGER